MIDSKTLNELLQKLHQADEHFATIYKSGTPWLAFWFPLRQQAHAADRNGVEEWIDSKFPGDNPQFQQTLEEEIRLLAYHLYERRCQSGAAGDAAGDWIQAERLLLDSTREPANGN